MIHHRVAPSSAVRTLFLLLVVLTAGLGTAGPASAHAQLVSTSPVDGTDLDASPDAVLLTFDEPVTTPPDAVRVFDADGARVDVAGAVAAATDPEVIGRALPQLEDGPYVVTWRAVSADGHPLRGAFVFTVGGGPQADATLVSALFGADDGPAGVLLLAVQGASYLAVLLLAGALFVARRLDEPVPGLVRGAAIAAGALALVTVPLQAAVVSGEGIGGAFDPAQLGAALVGPVGLAVVVRLVGLVLAQVTTGRAQVAAGAVVLLSFVLDGHTRTVEPAWLVVGADVVHLLAGAVWVGGLAVLLVALRRRRLADDPLGGATLLARWSSLATVAVGAVVIGGAALSWTTVRSTAAVLPTAYGQLLLNKLVLAGLLLALGAWNHWRLVPTVRRSVVPVPAGGSEVGVLDTPTAEVHDAGPRGWRLLRRLVAAELVLLVGVLGLTAVLTVQRPAAEAAGLLGEFQTTVPLTDELTLDVAVDPNIAGVNQVHLYLLDPTGRPVDGVEQVELSFSLPQQDIGPIVRIALVAGPGHWVLSGNELAVPGAWDVEVAARLDRFTEATASFVVVVGGSS